MLWHDSEEAEVAEKTVNSGFWVFRGANVKRPKGLQTWRQVTVQKTTNMFYKVGRGVSKNVLCLLLQNTRVCVQSPLVVLNT